MVAPRFTRILSVTLIVALLTSSVRSAEEIECPDKNEIQSLTTGDTERYIVRFKSSDQDAQTENSSIKAHYEYLERCLDKSKSKPKDDKSAVKDFSFNKFKAYTALFNTKLAKQIEKMPGILYVEKDGTMKTNYAVPQEFYRRAVDNKPQKNDDRIDQAKRPLDGKFEFPDTAGEGVDIYIIDTGVRNDHSEFGKRAKSGGAFCDGCNENDENGHGTHVASIAAGKTLGVARKANIIGIRVLDANGSGSNAGVIDGMRAVVEQHQKSKSKKSVANMSLGGGFSKAVNDAVDEMTKAGVHVVVAAGNESADSCTKSPASAKSAITVGATNENDETAAFFSNTGKCNDIFAPGSNIRGADFKSKTGQIVFSGTSQACPHVAGTVALLIAEDGNKSPAAMAKSLIGLSTKNVVKGINGDTPNNFLRIPEA